MRVLRRAEKVFRRCSAICFTVVAVAAPGAYSQIEKTLRFIPATVDFGVIREEDGEVSRSAKAVNISPDSTYIISARTSCGCTGAEYTEAVLAPGDTATVTITYDPMNRPGKFLKTAKFFTGEQRISNSLKIQGTVIPSRNNLDRSYPDRIGNLRFSSVILNAGEISRSEARPLFVGIYNDSERAIALTTDTDSVPLESALMPDTIEPFGIATLSLMLKGRMIPEKEAGFLYKAYLMDAQSGDTLACVPVGGSVKNQ